MFIVVLGSVKGGLEEFFLSSILILLSSNYRIFLSYSYCRNCIRWIISSCRFIFSLFSCYISSRVLYAPLFRAKFLIELIFGSLCFYWPGSEFYFLVFGDLNSFSYFIEWLGWNFSSNNSLPTSLNWCSKCYFLLLNSLKVNFLAVLTPPLSGVFYLASTLTGLAYQKKSFDRF